MINDDEKGRLTLQISVTNVQTYIIMYSYEYTMKWYGFYLPFTLQFTTSFYLFNYEIRSNSYIWIYNIICWTWAILVNYLVKINKFEVLLLKL